MGYRDEIEAELRDRAMELGDSDGEDVAVVRQLCEEFKLSRVEVLEILAYNFDDEDYYRDDMDGDHESALASVGWGMDESYNNYDYDEY